MLGTNIHAWYPPPSVFYIWQEADDTGPLFELIGYEPDLEDRADHVQQSCVAWLIYPRLRHPPAMLARSPPP